MNRHVIRRISDPRLWIYNTSYDVASNILRAVTVYKFYITSYDVARNMFRAVSVGERTLGSLCGEIGARVFRGRVWQTVYSPRHMM